MDVIGELGHLSQEEHRVCQENSLKTKEDFIKITLNIKNLTERDGHSAEANKPEENLVHGQVEL